MNKKAYLNNRIFLHLTGTGYINGITGEPFCLLSGKTLSIKISLGHLLKGSYKQDSGEEEEITVSGLPASLMKKIKIHITYTIGHIYKKERKNIAHLPSYFRRV